MSTRAARIEELFQAALELDGEARASFLARSCDADLRSEVEALLALDARPDERIDRAAPAALDLGANLLTGRRLGAYRLRRCLATGGMGSIYEAEQEHPERIVAIKVLRLGIAGTELERRFRVEASFLARLQHPAIAHVYEAGVSELDGQRVPWIAMELIEGARSITAFANDEGLDSLARIALFATVCEAVQHGHQRGVIHRDLKPANILIDRAGRPKLIDFGIARAVDPAATKRTEVGVLLGTVQYMSPEQCLDAHDLDVRSDVYSLGVVLYELLCARLPHDLEGAPLPRAVRVIQEDPPRRPSTAARVLRGDLETILLTALEKDRARRYQSAALLAEDLRRFLRREPIRARAPSLPHRLALFTRRHRLLVGSLSTVFLAALAAAVVSTRFAWRERRAREREERSSYLANIAAADLSLRTFDVAGARQRLERVPAVIRGWEWNYLWKRLDLARLVIPGPLSRCESVDLVAGRIAAAWHYPESSWITLHDPESGAELGRSPALGSVSTRLACARDGSIVWGDLDGSLWRWERARAHATIFAGRHGGLVTGVRVTDDGLVVSASLDGTLRTWDLESARALSVHGDGSVPWRDLDLSGDGRRAALGGANGRVLVLELGSGRETLVLRGSGRETLAVALHPDGVRLATGASDGTMRILDIATGREVRSFSGHEGEVQDLAFSDDGAWLASAASDRTVRLWDVEHGLAHRVLHGHEALVKCLAFSPDGSRLVSGGYDGELRLWDPHAEASGRRVDAHSGYVRDLAFSPDGKLLASASFDRTVELIDTTTWRVARTLSGHGDRVTSVAFHPAGALVASASNDGTVRVWDARSGSLVRALEDHEDGVLTLAFSPSGELLASGSRDGRLLLREADGFRIRASVEAGQGVEQLAFDEKGERLALVLEDGTLLVRSAARDRELWRRPPAGLLHDVDFSPDGETLAVAAGDFDGTDLGIELLDARTGAQRATLIGHTDVVLALAFAPGGDRLVSGSADATVRLWDIDTSQEALVLRGHESWVFAVGFSPDGTLLASGGGRESGAGIGVRVWEARAGR